jgi:hypothetical protein
MRTDRDRVLELLKLNHLGHADLRELAAIIDRNQNDREFSSRAWVALRDWCRSVEAVNGARDEAERGVRSDP